MIVRETAPCWGRREFAGPEAGVARLDVDQEKAAGEVQLARACPRNTAP